MVAKVVLYKNNIIIIIIIITVKDIIFFRSVSLKPFWFFTSGFFFKHNLTWNFIKLILLVDTYCASSKV